MLIRLKTLHRILFLLGVLLISGLNYAWHCYGGWRLPVALYKKPVEVVGHIASLPQKTSLGTSFLFHMQQLNGQKVEATLRLTGYLLKGSQQDFKLQAGDLWRFSVRLKPAHGLHNPGGFDYERYLALQGVHTTGYLIEKSKSNQRLVQESAPYPLLRLRQKIQQQIEASLKHYPEEAAIISALTVGSTSGMSTEQWRVFQLTGTSHLIAISGLHIGLVAAVGYFLVSLGAKLFPFILLRVPLPTLASFGACFFALVYAALAGFAWPTQRALMMIVTLSITQIFYRSMPVWRRLALSFLVILLIEPWGIFSASFVLSFCAVACLAYSMGGRWKNSNKFSQALKMQWAIFVGLLPVTLFYFHQVSLVMLLANFIAIPWVAWCVVPLSLFACFCLLCSASLAQFLWVIAAQLLSILWVILEYLSQFSFAAWHHSLSQPWVLILCSLGVLLLLAPTGIPGRSLGCIALGMLLFYQSPKPKLNEFWVTLLDVGQGLSVVVQTAEHVLIYDTGVRFPGAFDAGRDVVVPFLEARALNDIDMLMISHGDNDHSGGVEAIMAALNVKQVFSSIPQKFSRFSAQSCVRAQHWQWDGIDFNILSPPIGSDYEGNNSSCVLHIGRAQHSILLTGDIQKQRERYLLEQSLFELKARVLVAPHHGSLSSSSVGFVQAVSARVVLFATGFLNRYRFPNPKVVSRYEKYHATMYSSARDGAIELHFKPNGQLKIDTALRHKDGYEL